MHVKSKDDSKRVVRNLKKRNVGTKEKTLERDLNSAEALIIELATGRGSRIR